MHYSVDSIIEQQLEVLSPDHQTAGKIYDASIPTH